MSGLTFAQPPGFCYFAGEGDFASDHPSTLGPFARCRGRATHPPTRHGCCIYALEVSDWSGYEIGSNCSCLRFGCDDGGGRCNWSLEGRRRRREPSDESCMTNTGWLAVAGSQFWNRGSCDHHVDRIHVCARRLPPGPSGNPGSGVRCEKLGGTACIHVLLLRRLDMLLSGGPSYAVQPPAPAEHYHTHGSAHSGPAGHGSG